MYAFLVGIVVAVVLTGGTIYVYDIANITMVERSSPSAYVRIESDASETARGTGYGTPENRQEESRE